MSQISQCPSRRHVTVNNLAPLALSFLQFIWYAEWFYKRARAPFSRCDLQWSHHRLFWQEVVSLHVTVRGTAWVTRAHPNRSNTTANFPLFEQILRSGSSCLLLWTNDLTHSIIEVGYAEIFLGQWHRSDKKTGTLQRLHLFDCSCLKLLVAGFQNSSPPIQFIHYSLLSTSTDFLQFFPISLLK